MNSSDETSFLEAINMDRTFSYSEVESIKITEGDKTYRLSHYLPSFMGMSAKETYVYLTTDFDTISSRIMPGILKGNDTLTIALDSQMFDVYFDANDKFLAEPVSKNGIASKCLKSDMPNLQAEQLNGHELNYAANDKFVLIDFWASYCAPCIEEMYEYKSVLKEFSDNLEIVSITLDKNDAGLATALNDVETGGFNWKQLKINEIIRSYYCKPSLNCAYLYSPNGKLIKVGIKADEIEHYLKSNSA